MAVEENPLKGPAPTEVLLPNAPLVRVIAQVRFSSVLAVQGAEFIAPFQESIRQEYPVLQMEHVPSLLVGPEEVAAGQEVVAWRFSSADSEWRASLTPEFIALETTAYQSRSNFIGRMKDLLATVREHLAPAVVQRIGLRYIAQVTGEPLGRISDLVRPNLLGLTDTSLFSHVHNALSDVPAEAPEERAQLRLRWGQLAAGATHDPNAVVPINEPSWILDFDIFRSEQPPFDVALLTADLEQFAERLYSMFRWSVTDRFLEYYGGQL